MALISKASLLMVPSTYEDGKLYNVLPSGNRAPDSTDQNSGYDQTRADFDFDRGSNLAATRINSDGLIEKGRENLVTHSNEFDNTDGWSLSLANLTSGQSGYDGTDNAYLLNAIGTNARINQNLSLDLCVVSIYAKKGSVDFVRLSTAVANMNAYFDLANGTIGTLESGVIDATIEQVGSTGWYRCTMCVSDSNTIRVLVAQADGDSSGTSGNIYIQDCQVEKGLIASSYIDSGATTGKAGILADMPRINYDANGENGALLLEPLRSNIFQQSEYFDGNAWTKYGGVVLTNNNAVSPEGLHNATKLTDAGGLYDQIPYTPNTDYTYSLFAKTDTATSIQINFVDQAAGYLGGTIKYTFATNATSIIIQSQNGSVTADKEDYGNGWIRVIMKFKTDVAQNYNYQQIDFQGGDGWIYGAQLEAGSYPSSYIPTHGAAVSRSADSCSVTGVSDVIGQTEGTLFLDLKPLEFADASRYLSIESSSGAGSGWIGIFASSPNKFRIYGDGFDLNFGGYSVGDRTKIALTYKNGVATDVYINGVNKGSITASTTGKDYSILKIGSAIIGGVGAGNFNQCTIYPTALTNAELATLTTL